MNLLDRHARHIAMVLSAYDRLIIQFVATASTRYDAVDYPRL